jgi:sulfopyruvate decarboxylase TPP-binding subunit
MRGFLGLNEWRSAWAGESSAILLAQAGISGLLQDLYSLLKTTGLPVVLLVCVCRTY